MLKKNSLNRLRDHRWHYISGQAGNVYDICFSHNTVALAVQLCRIANQRLSNRFLKMLLHLFGTLPMWLLMWSLMTSHTRSLMRPSEQLLLVHLLRCFLWGMSFVRIKRTLTWPLLLLKYPGRQQDGLQFLWFFRHKSKQMKMFDNWEVPKNKSSI